MYGIARLRAGSYGGLVFLQAAEDQGIDTGAEVGAYGRWVGGKTGRERAAGGGRKCAELWRRYAANDEGGVGRWKARHLLCARGGKTDDPAVLPNGLCGKAFADETGGISADRSEERRVGK